MYEISAINEIVNGSFLQYHAETAIIHIAYDSRNLSLPRESLFFALQTEQSNGHRYIRDAYNKGVRNFIVHEKQDYSALAESNIIFVENTLDALQQLAKHHRRQFKIPVIGITGSNGKTIVKEWLYQLLQDEEKIIRSPKSFNSRLGVPLSIWNISPYHSLAIIEAGISKEGEMQRLADIIRPTIGILTNIGAAHDEGFASQESKIKEKLKLFRDTAVVVLPEQFSNYCDAPTRITWGESTNAVVRIINKRTDGGITLVHLNFKNEDFTLSIPFSDIASIENVITCTCLLLHLGYNGQKINERLQRLHAVDMRLQLKHGMNNTTLINDSYSADLTSLRLALNFMSQQKTVQERTVILSDFVETGKDPQTVYQLVAQSLQEANISRVIAIGEKTSLYLPEYFKNYRVETFADTESFLLQFRHNWFRDEIILIKGARRFRFERIVDLLETKVHQTVMQIDLDALAHNLKQYRQVIHPRTKIMAMVKAFSYGSGGPEIASVLQFNHIDYLGVAYADEGIELRRAGITTPVMVMNAEPNTYALLTEYNLEPVIYSFTILQSFTDHLKQAGLNRYPVHIELETGMNRLGFSATEVDDLVQQLEQSSYVSVASVFSHLAASEDPEHDEFTNHQFLEFQKATSKLETTVDQPFLKHLSNSAAIIRHPHLQLDMVRLGIGLYGIEISGHQLDLQPVASLRTTIAQIKKLHAGDTVGYNRRGVIKEDSVIATVRIGYADGYSRSFGNGVGKMFVNGHAARVIGSVCMDMTMIDITGIPDVLEGDEVIVFGKELPVQQLAEWAGTIPYDLLTSVSQRVKRIYYHG